MQQRRFTLKALTAAVALAVAQVMIRFFSVVDGLPPAHRSVVLVVFLLALGHDPWTVVETATSLLCA